MRRLAMAACVAALVTAAPAAAQDDQPAAPAGGTCKAKPRKTYRTAAVLRRGFPVRITCNGPASVLVTFRFWGRAWRDWLARTYSGGYPGDEVQPRRPFVFKAAATRTVYLPVQRWARRAMPRFRRIRLHLNWGVLRVNGRLGGGPRDFAKSWLIR
jgi:hypothetical protein